VGCISGGCRHRLPSIGPPGRSHTSAGTRPIAPTTRAGLTSPYFHDELIFHHTGRLLDALEAHRQREGLLFAALLVTDINDQTSLLLVRVPLLYRCRVVLSSGRRSSILQHQESHRKEII
jgi:hypothetical protein